MTKCEGISVIICCYNSESRIRGVLEHLQNQVDADFPWEVVLVDNASSDRTADVARESWAGFRVPLDIVHESTPGLSFARKKGIQASRYPIVVFVDDDNLLDRNYISKARQIMEEHQDVGLAGGLGNPVTEKDPPAWFEEFKGAYAVGSQSDATGYLPEKRGYLVGAGLIMRKPVWESIFSSGIDLVLTGRKGKSLSSGEDYEISLLFRMAGYQLWYDQDLVFGHVLPEARLKWEYLKRLFREFGKTQPVILLYKSEISQKNWVNRMKNRNWMAAFLVKLKNLLKTLPSYIGIRMRYREGSTIEFDYLYYSGAMSQHLRLLFKFPSIKKKIRIIKGTLKELRPAT